MPQVVAALALAAAAAWNDCRERRIPNRLVVMGMVAGLVLGLVTGGLRGLGASVVGLVAGIGMLFVPFALGWVGAGDVKLLAGIGAILGARGAALSMLYGALVGGVMSAAVLSKSSGMLPTLGGATPHPLENGRESTNPCLVRRRRLGLTLAAIGAGFAGFLAFVVSGILGRSLRVVRPSGDVVLAPRSGLAIPYSAAIGIGLVIAIATGFPVAPI